MLKKSKLLSLVILLFLQFGCDQYQTVSDRKNVADIITSFNNSESGRILIAAHRAQHTKYPENSLAAIKQSIKNSLDIIELDVRATKDNVLVLMHDSKIDRTTNGSGLLSDILYSDLQKLELIKTDSSEIIHKIPTFEEALIMAKDKIMIDVDIKGAPVRKLAEIVYKTQTQSQVIFFDSEFAVLDSLLLVDSTFCLMPRARSESDVDMILKKYRPKVIHIDDNFYTKSVVDKIKVGNARIWINSLGGPDSIAKAGDLHQAFSGIICGGANMIQTDLPVTLLTYLETNDFR